MSLCLFVKKGGGVVRILRIGNSRSCSCRQHDHRRDSRDPAARRFLLDHESDGDGALDVEVGSLSQMRERWVRSLRSIGDPFLFAINGAIFSSQTIKGAGRASARLST